MPVLPTPLRYALSLIAGVLSVLNQTTVHFGAPWTTFFTVALAFFAALGVIPVLGAAFQTVLSKLVPQAWLVSVHALITAAVAAAEAALTTNGWSPAAHGAVAAVVVVLLGLGFAPAPNPLNPSKKRPTPKPKS